jgi:hypothetical protein
MAKPRKNYYKKRAPWQWIIFYLLIAAVAFSLLYYSGVLGLGPHNPKINGEVEYFQ